MTKKFRTKIEISSERKEFFKGNKKHCVIFKGLSLKQIKPIFLIGESPTLTKIINYIELTFEC